MSYLNFESQHILVLNVNIDRPYAFVNQSIVENHWYGIDQISFDSVCVQ